MSFGFDTTSCGRLRASASGVLSAAAIALCAVTSPASALADKAELRPLDPAERGLIARLNDERQVIPGPGGAALPRLAISSALTQAASDYADYLHVTGQFSHHAGGTDVADRAFNAGWTPAPGARLTVAEDLFEGESAEAAYSAWKASPPHAAVLFHPDAHWVGVGRSGNKWVLLVGGQCARDQCETTPVRLEEAAFLASPPRPARLRYLLRRRGRKVALGVRVLRGEGRIVVRLRRTDGRSARRTAFSLRGNLWRYMFRLPTTGTCRATIRFRPDRGWTGALVRSRPFIVSE